MFNSGKALAILLPLICLALITAVGITDGLTITITSVNSAAIIVREGLEAVLVLGAVLGYLGATQDGKKYVSWVYAGIVAAIVLSFATWWVAQWLITVTPASREVIEGMTSLIAVAVLLYVTNWLFHKVYVLDWMSFVKEQVGRALGTGSALALAGLGFAVVYREGFETVLFYRALLFDAEPLPVVIGFVAGCVIILALAYAILHMSRRLPLKPFFTATGVLLLLLAINFTGAGVHELQEAGVIATSPLAGVPRSVVLQEALGIFPTLETILAQVIFVLIVILTFGYSRLQLRPPVQSRTQREGQVEIEAASR